MQGVSYMISKEATTKPYSKIFRRSINNLVQDSPDCNTVGNVCYEIRITNEASYEWPMDFYEFYMSTPRSIFLT